MQEMFRRAHAHQGASFVEVYQNCNVFNDGAFNLITKKDAREAMLIDLRHGEPIRFGVDQERGVVLDDHGVAAVVDVADVGEDALLVHDENNEDPGLAFSLSRLARGPHEPTPVGVFRAVDRPEYAAESSRQLAAAQERSGPGDLRALLHSQPTWDVR